MNSLFLPKETFDLIKSLCKLSTQTDTEKIITMQSYFLLKVISETEIKLYFTSGNEFIYDVVIYNTLNNLSCDKYCVPIKIFLTKKYISELELTQSTVKAKNGDLEEDFQTIEPQYFPVRNPLKLEQDLYKITLDRNALKVFDALPVSLKSLGFTLNGKSIAMSSLCYIPNEVLETDDIYCIAFKNIKALLGFCDKVKFIVIPDRKVIQFSHKHLGLFDFICEISYFFLDKVPPISMMEKSEMNRRVRYKSSEIEFLFEKANGFGYFFAKSQADGRFYHIKYDENLEIVASKLPYDKSFVADKNFGIDLNVLIKLSKVSKEFEIHYNDKLGSGEFTLVPLKIKVNGATLYIAPRKNKE